MGKEFERDSRFDIQRKRIRENQRAFPFWIRMGQLKIIYGNGRSKTFFNGLSHSESSVMRSKFLKEIEKRK